LSSKQSRFQVSVDVLATINNGNLVMEKIMDTCKLSLDSTHDILTFLAAKGYVDELCDTHNGTSYHISAKGKAVLRYCSHMEDVVPMTLTNSE